MQRGCKVAQTTLSLSLGGGLPRRSITETRVDTSMPLSDKDGLRGWHCRPEKCRYQHRAIPTSRRWSKSLFLVAEGQPFALCRKSSETVMLKHNSKKLLLKYRCFIEKL